MADNILENLRVDLVEGLTEAVIKDLVDDLRKEKVLNKNETEVILQKIKPRFKQARDLIDSVKVKGSEASEIIFFHLEKRDKTLYDKLNIINHLQALKGEEATSSGQHVTPGEQKSSGEAEQATAKHYNKDEYKMDSIPRGLCVIINNENFKNPKNDRAGSKFDVVSLQEVFTYLGFVVEDYKDLSADEIKTLMTRYSMDDRHGDCFVCCVLSHGNQSGVIGKDDETCPLRDITSPFDGDNCSSLTGKPKVFFIQACRGKEMQSKVSLEADHLSGESDQEFDNDEYTIAGGSDFLTVMSTVEAFCALRDPNSGSWFIQSLCKHLKDGSERGHDILKILTDINNDVSRKEGTAVINSKIIDAKMVPEPHFTLRKTLIFRVPEGQST